MSHPPPPQNRRLHPRYPLLLQVQFRGDADVHAFTENLSEGGLFVRTDRSFSVGQRVTLQLSFSPLFPAVELEVEIVRCRASQDGLPAGVAVKVVTAHPEVKKKLTELARAAARDSSHPPPSFRLLLVEDNRLLANMYMDGLEAMLGKSASVQVESAPDGEKAWERLARDPPVDLLIADRHMPLLDGIELLKQVRMSPKLRTLPVVIVSGDVSAASEIAARKAGANIFLRKPLNLTELVFTVQALLHLQR